MGVFMRKKICGILAALSLSLAASAHAQSDFQLWTELKYAHPFGKSPWTLHWATENRWGDDASNHILFNTTLGFDYRVFKWFKPGFFYRFEKSEGKPRENRIFPQAEFIGRLGPVEGSTRQRFEIRFFPDETRFRYRSRFKVAFPIKSKPVSFSPYISEELLVEPSNGGFNQNRFAAGNAFGFLDGKITFDLYYMLRMDQADPDWTKRHILGTSLALKF